MRQINGELLTHGQAVKGEIVMGHYSKAHPLRLGMVLQAAPKKPGKVMKETRSALLTLAEAEEAYRGHWRPLRRSRESKPTAEQSSGPVSTRWSNGLTRVERSTVRAKFPAITTICSHL